MFQAVEKRRFQQQYQYNIVAIGHNTFWAASGRWRSLAGPKGQSRVLLRDYLIYPNKLTNPLDRDLIHQSIIGSILIFLALRQKNIISQDMEIYEK